MYILLRGETLSCVIDSWRWKTVYSPAEVAEYNSSHFEKIGGILSNTPMRAAQFRAVQWYLESRDKLLQNWEQNKFEIVYSNSLWLI